MAMNAEFLLPMILSLESLCNVLVTFLLSTLLCEPEVVVLHSEGCSSCRTGLAVPAFLKIILKDKQTLFIVCVKLFLPGNSMPFPHEFRFN